MKRGFTLIEVVVAMGIFAILMVGTSLLLISTLRGAKKAASQITVRSEGARIMDVLASTLRFSNSITGCSPVRGASVSATLYDGSPINFKCTVSGTDLYLASGSGRLTSTGVTVSSCSNVFVCPDSKTILIRFGLQKAGTSLQTEGTSRIDFDAEVRLRN